MYLARTKMDALIIYRILVVGDEIADAMCYTASHRKKYASNVSLGTSIEIVSVDDIFAAEQQ